MEPTSEQAPQTVQARPEESVLGAEPAADSQQREQPIVEDEPARPNYGEFELPEGVTADADSLKPATELFAEIGLNQDQAQKFIDLAMARETAAAHKSVQAFVDLQNQWVSEIKADPDIGGDRLKASLSSANRAIDRLDVPGLREALNFTGAGNHPAIVKAFVRLGQMIAEDRFRPGHPARPQVPRSPAEVIYDGNPRT
ncbi:MAG TPA: hypothetical protein VGJ56_02720 [Reyranella sp.]|jgi:hypothetical protein